MPFEPTIDPIVVDSVQVLSSQGNGRIVILAKSASGLDHPDFYLGDCQCKITITPVSDDEKVEVSD